MTRDFTLSRYNELCNALLTSKYNTITVQEYIQGQAVEPFVMLRHDVDIRPQMGHEIVQKEMVQKGMGIRATYYLRMFSLI